MHNTDKLIQTFANTLLIDPSTVTDDLTYNAIAEWDSVAHMSLIAALEEAFGVMLDTDDIINLSSVAQAKSILGRYDVSF